MAQLDPAFIAVIQALKASFDPNGIIAAGKYS
jgi:hypothetical protein